MSRQAGMTTIDSAGELLSQLERLLATRVEALIAGDRECAALRNAIAALNGEPLPADIPPRAPSAGLKPRPTASRPKPVPPAMKGRVQNGQRRADKEAFADKVEALIKAQP